MFAEVEMELVIVAVILLANTALWWKLRTDDGFLRAYVRTSPKAFLWRKVFGPERAAEIIRTRLVPFGMVVWVVMLLVLAGLSVMSATLGVELPQ